jgi:uncharacterized protein
VILCDVNVLVHAHKSGSPRHSEFHGWLLDRMRADEPLGVSDLVLTRFIRTVTHPGAFDRPSNWTEAREFVHAVRSSPNAVPVSPGRRHWEIFLQLADQVSARGNDVPDAYLAALAIEAGAEWITTDRGYGRYPGLRWRHPLDPTR